MPRNMRDLPLEVRALRAFKAAVKKAFAEHARQGLPVYVWSDGRVVKLPPEKLRSRPPSRRATQSKRRQA